MLLQSKPIFQNKLKTFKNTSKLLFQKLIQKTLPPYK